MLLELVNPQEGIKSKDCACRDYCDFSAGQHISRPGMLSRDGKMVRFDNDLIIRYIDKVIVEDGGYRVLFKAGIKG